MKLFSRKALVAAATTAAVSLSGVTVANAETAAPTTTTTKTPAPTTTKTPAPTETPAPKDKDSSSSSSSDDSDSKGSSISDMKPSEIRDWIAVFTAIIGALGTVFAFYNKNFAK